MSIVSAFTAVSAAPPRAMSVVSPPALSNSSSAPPSRLAATFALPDERSNPANTYFDGRAAVPPPAPVSVPPPASVSVPLPAPVPAAAKTFSKSKDWSQVLAYPKKNEEKKKEAEAKAPKKKPAPRRKKAKAKGSDLVDIEAEHSGDDTSGSDIDSAVDDGADLADFIDDDDSDSDSDGSPRRVHKKRKAPDDASLARALNNRRERAAENAEAHKHGHREKEREEEEEQGEPEPSDGESLGSQDSETGSDESDTTPPPRKKPKRQAPPPRRPEAKAHPGGVTIVVEVNKKERARITTTHDYVAAALAPQVMLYASEGKRVTVYKAPGGSTFFVSVK